LFGDKTNEELVRELLVRNIGVELLVDLSNSIAVGEHGLFAAFPFRPVG
jgi:hypothetical protein